MSEAATLMSDAAQTTQAAAPAAQANAGGTAPAAQSQPQQEGASFLTQQAASASAENAANGNSPDEKQQEPKPQGAPEKYDFKVPDGHQVDSAVLDAFGASAKKFNLTQEAAQGVLAEVIPAMQARQAEAVKAIHAEWVAAVKADKDLGGSAFEANLGLARKGLDSFGSPELKTLLDTSGLGNHPEVIRLLHRIGKEITSDGYIGGRQTEGAKQPWDRLYGSQQS